MGSVGEAAALDRENEEGLCKLQVPEAGREVRNVPTDGEVWTVCTLPDGANQTWADGNPPRRAIKSKSQNFVTPVLSSNHTTRDLPE